MKWFHRIFVSLKRKQKQSLIFIFIIFIMGVVINSTTLLNQISDSIRKDMIEKLGANVSITGNVNDIIYADGSSSYYDELTNYYQKIKHLLIHDSVNYADSPLVTLTYTDKMSTYDENSWSTRFPFDKTNSAFERIYIYGMYDNRLVDVMEQKIEIIEGRTFTDTEMKSSENVIIVSEDYFLDDQGIRSEIRIGDVIPISVGISSDLYHEKDQVKNIPFKVIGKYRKIEQISNGICQDFTCAVNPFYIPSSSAKNMITIYYDLLNHKEALKVFAAEAFFKLKNADDLEAFANHASLLFPKEEAYNVISSNDSYEKIASSIHEITNLLITTMITVIIMGGLILMFISFIFFKERLPELGIYMALGEKKKHMLFQLIGEMLILAMIGMNLALFTSYIFVKPFVHQVYKSIDLSSIENQLHIENEIILDDYKTEFNAKTISIIYISTIFIIICSSSIPIVYVIKLKPKDILSN